MAESRARLSCREAEFCLFFSVFGIQLLSRVHFYMQLCKTKLKATRSLRWVWAQRGHPCPMAGRALHKHFLVGENPFARVAVWKTSLLLANRLR